MSSPSCNTCSFQHTDICPQQFSYKARKITAEQGEKGKKAALLQYQRDSADYTRYRNLIQHHARLWQHIELAASAYTKDPSIEHADAFLEAVYEVKRTIRGYPEYISEEGKQAIFDRGHFLENTVIDTFCRLVGANRIPESRMFRHKDYPNTTANIDAILSMPSGNLAIFEAKTAARGKEGEWMGNRIPANYVCQCHQYMSVLDDPRIEGTYIGMIPVADLALDGTYIASAYTDEFYHHYIERDLNFEEEILENEKWFWDSYVVNGVKPNASKDPKIDKAVKLRYEPSPISDPTIPPQELSYEQWEPKLDTLLAAEKDFIAKKAELDHLEQFRDVARLEVLDALQGSQCGIFRNAAGEAKITVKNTAISKTTIDAKKLKQFYPEAWAATKKDSAYTRFSIRE